eukprot:1036142-Prymnesium_polylepis.1
MERFGAVGDDMQAMVRGACGDLATAIEARMIEPSRRRRRSPTIVLASVMADAAMVDGVIARRTSTVTTGGCLCGG